MLEVVETLRSNFELKSLAKSDCLPASWGIGPLRTYIKAYQKDLQLINAIPGNNVGNFSNRLWSIIFCEIVG
jgi:hypothetical protein